MRRYVLTAELEGSMTSVPVLARNDDHARHVAYGVISQKHVSDKRWDKGEVTLTTQYEKENKLIEIKAEEG